MTKRPLPMTPAYMQYVRGLHRLHALTVQGLDDSPEADAVRDGMDEPWYALSEAERRRIKGLSEDLYSISNPPAEPLPPNPQAARKLMEAVEAYRDGEWDLALGVLRRWGRYLGPADLSFRRGQIWQDAGDEATSTLFYRHATELDPADEIYKYFYLNALAQSDPAAALALAEEAIEDGEGARRPNVLLAASHVLFMSTRPMAPADQATVYRRLAEVLGRTIPELSTAAGEGNPLLRSTYTNLALVLGYCHLRLGDARAGLRAFNLGLAADPGNLPLLMGRGLARYATEPGSTEDFARAIDLGLREVWPYFYLAHNHFVARRFADCLKMCDRALDFPAAGDVRARLHEWRAVARAELGFPTEMARADFEEAVRLAPEDDEIRQNFDKFSRSGGQPGARPHDWATPRASAIQALYRAEPGPLMPAA